MAKRNPAGYCCYYYYALKVNLVLNEILNYQAKSYYKVGVFPMVDEQNRYLGSRGAEESRKVISGADRLRAPLETFYI